MSTTISTDVDPIIEFKNVNFQYLPRDASERGPDFDPERDGGFKVQDINLTVRRGERVLLIGFNGASKSTILNLIAGKRMPSSGTATVLGQPAFHETGLQRHVALIGAPWPSEALFSCKVESVLTPSADEPRRDALARAFHIPMKAQLNRMSSGQKRRVQIIHGLMTAKQVILMDECSTDIDVAERVTLMSLVAKECETRGACCVYATHILDGVESWATRVVMVHQGRIVRDEPLSASSAAAEAADATTTTTGGGMTLEQKVTKWLVELSGIPGDGVFRIPENYAAVAAAAAEQHQGAFDAEFNSLIPPEQHGKIVGAENFTFTDLYENVTDVIQRGRRCLLCSCNGAGKSRLLELLSGHTFFTNKDNQLTIAGRPAFQDTKLHNIISFGGHWWPKVPDGEMHVREMVPLPLGPRAEALRALLAIDMDWDVRHRSTGELKRIQLFMKLYSFRPLILLDEATADLDIHMRANLLRFLFDESELRGVTVIYATHIFEGLGEWPTDVLVVDRLYRKWERFACQKGMIVNKTADAGPEPLRKFLIAKLCAIKETELWEQWFCFK